MEPSPKAYIETLTPVYMIIAKAGMKSFRSTRNWEFPVRLCLIEMSEVKPMECGCLSMS